MSENVKCSMCGRVLEFGNTPIVWTEAGTVVKCGPCADGVTADLMGLRAKLEKQREMRAELTRLRAELEEAKERADNAEKREQNYKSRCEFWQGSSLQRDEWLKTKEAQLAASEERARELEERLTNYQGRYARTWNDLVDRESTINALRAEVEEEKACYKRAHKFNAELESKLAASEERARKAEELHVDAMNVAAEAERDLATLRSTSVRVDVLLRWMDRMLERTRHSTAWGTVVSYETMGAELKYILASRSRRGKEGGQ